MSFFVTLRPIVYKELLPKWGYNVTKNDKLFFPVIIKDCHFWSNYGRNKIKTDDFFKNLDINMVNYGLLKGQ